MADTRPLILLTRLWPDAAMQRMAELGNVTVDAQDRPLSRRALMEAMQRFDILCPTVSDRLPREILNIPDRRARLLANFGAGTDHIDLEACRALGLPVSNTPDVLTDATAEIALTLMLMTARRAGEAERQLRAGLWAGWGPTHMLGRGLSHRSLGLVGFGRIARRLAVMAHTAFGMSIHYFSRRKSDDFPFPSTHHPVLEAMLPQIDVLSIHVPGGAETRGMIGAEQLALLPQHALLVNTARGDVVDEAALIAALQSGQIAGAGLDVYAREPHVPDALRTMENVTLLPHLGSATLETRTAMGMKAAANVAAFLAGRPLPDRVA